MRFFCYEEAGKPGVALVQGEGAVALSSLDTTLPRDLDTIVAAGPSMLERIAEAAGQRRGRPVYRERVRLLASFRSPQKIICIGLNYAEHAKETQLPTTAFPTVFTRFTSTLLSPGEPILCPKVSGAVDYEVELVAVVGKYARYVSHENALDHIAGYTVANDVSIRDYQMATSQFTIGKNFDATCPLAADFVTADELPPGAKGLKLETRLNGQVLQSDTTNNMIFDVATLIQKLSEVMSLEAGDIILTGTPSGVGYTRNPPVFMKSGDTCEVSVESIAVLSNPVRNEIC